ncbi:hypothetical protein [Mesorhizobium sp. J8]|uniref:hypothetical protein n=1 Tax=Mesorhizobium sp. J8 TaxID=2777475 RepID=UPI001934C6FB|nr:hypothetical protein [Mesorhizobium sp. J8]BCM20160.1 hypothetical protein MJ8_39480 [Mesorhizobium sp. J8]
MASNVFRFNESWNIPEGTPQEVWDVLSDAQLLPLWRGDAYKESSRSTRRARASSVPAPGQERAAPCLMS